MAAILVRASDHRRCPKGRPRGAVRIADIDRSRSCASSVAQSTPRGLLNGARTAILWIEAPEQGGSRGCDNGLLHPEKNYCPETALCAGGGRENYERRRAAARLRNSSKQISQAPLGRRPYDRITVPVWTKTASA